MERSITPTSNKNTILKTDNAEGDQSEPEERPGSAFLDSDAYRQQLREVYKDISSQDDESRPQSRGGGKVSDKSTSSSDGDFVESSRRPGSKSRPKTNIHTVGKIRKEVEGWKEDTELAKVAGVMADEPKVNYVHDFLDTVNPDEISKESDKIVHPKHGQVFVYDDIDATTTAGLHQVKKISERDGFRWRGHGFTKGKKDATKVWTNKMFAEMEVSQAKTNQFRKHLYYDPVLKKLLIRYEGDERYGYVLPECRKAAGKDDFYSESERKFPTDLELFAPNAQIANSFKKLHPNIYKEGSESELKSQESKQKTSHSRKKNVMHSLRPEKIHHRKTITTTTDREEELTAEQLMQAETVIYPRK
jgi:hypothetical protein